MAEEKNNLKKKSKRGILIVLAIIIIAFIIGAILAIITINNESSVKKSDTKKSVGTEWGDAYYVYLEENMHDMIKILPEDEEFESINIRFIENEENPLMLVEVNSEETSALRVCYIADNKVEVTEDIYSTDEIAYSDVEYMYNIENENYDWYVHTRNEENEIYTTIDDYVYNPEETMEFSMEDTYSDDSLHISEFDQTFIKIENVDISTLEITNPELSKDEIFESVSTSITKYKTSEELITEEVEEETQEGITNLEILKAEVEEKQKEEEAARKKAEEEEKGLQVGNHTLKYGTYEGTEYNFSYEVESTTCKITLNVDGTYELTSSNEEVMQSSSGTYKIENIYGLENAVNLSNGGVYIVLQDNVLTNPAGSGAEFKYVEE